jgi:hypothetical protein
MSTSTRGLLDIITPRRLVVGAVLVLAVLVTVVGLQRTDTSTPVDACGPVGPIVRFLPCPGVSTLVQGTIGVDMQPGWQVDLYVDNTPIPKDQLEIEGSDYYYQPLPGSATGALAPGNHTARVVYYQNLAQEATGASRSWSFAAH